MNDSKSGVAQRINAVRARFVDALPEIRQALTGHWHRLRHLGWEVGHARQILGIAHKLAGTGTTFGFPEISRVAATLDVSLGQVLAVEGEPATETVMLLGQQVGDLLRVLVTTPGVDQDALAMLPDPAQGQGALLVLIDDDEFIRARLSALLEGAGYRVMAFAEPDAAMSLLSVEQPAAVLLDLMFPGRRRPAFDVVADIRGETGERTPVIVISSRMDFASRLDATRAGADAFLAKPLDDRQVLEAVGQFTARNAGDSWRCLVIDDDEILSSQLVIWLREAGIVAEANASPQESWLHVREFNPDVVLLDINMPACNGIELATMLRQNAATARLPIIFMTADQAHSTRSAAVAAGSDDFLLKPLTRDMVIRSVIARARLGRRADGQVSRVTRDDAHAGGLSRHFFFAEFEQALDDAAEGDVQPALILLTVAAAAGVVQSQGIISAAALSQQLSMRLSAAGASTWSMLGDALVGWLPGRDTVTGHRANLQKLLRRLEADAYDVQGLAVSGALRAAVLFFGQHEQTAASVALTQAEQLLSMALVDGGPIVAEGYLGGTQTTPEVVGKLPVGRLRLVFQPIVTIDGVGVPVHAVLARLSDREGNLLPAGRFLAQIEKRGWLPELDAWVFARAHAMLVEELPPETAMFLVVNIAVASLVNAIYMETVLATLAASPMRNTMQCLIFAVPESAAVTHRGVLDQLNKALLSAGCALMFTGYGVSEHSAAMLGQFQPLFVRLESAVARRLGQSPAFSSADRALMETATSANVAILAGHIESASSLSALWSKGVRRFQGYFIQEPAAVIQGSGSD